MNISVEIDDNKVCNFTTGAFAELNSQSKNMIENLIDEACRVEAGRRESDIRQEITQADVIDGAKFSKKNHHHKKSWLRILLKGLCPAIAIIPGFIYDKNDTTSIVWICLIIAFVSGATVYLIKYED